MICPQCGEREDIGYYTGVDPAGEGDEFVTGVHCRVCGYSAKSETKPAKPETNEPVDETPGRFDEMPGIKKALEQGDMDYVTDERTEWMVIEIELARAVIEAARNPGLVEGNTALGPLDAALKQYDALRVPIHE